MTKLMIMTTFCSLIPTLSQALTFNCKGIGWETVTLNTTSLRIKLNRPLSQENGETTYFIKEGHAVRTNSGYGIRADQMVKADVYSIESHQLYLLKEDHTTQGRTKGALVIRDKGGNPEQVCYKESKK